MRFIAVTAIIINPSRQRQEFEPEAMQELKTSIEERGLLHPPVLRETAEGWVLVAGERRLRAVSEIYELGGTFCCDGDQVPDNMIPYTSLGELGELEAEEAELDENLKRKDLTWQEHAAATARLHKLRQTQRNIMNESAVASAELPGPEHTVADTALELLGRSDGSYQDAIRKEIIVSRHLNNPAIAKAKSADEAFKILRKQEEATKNVELANIVGATFSAEKHSLINGNCLATMEEFAGGAGADLFDVILTDPPYGMDAQDFGDAGGKLSGIEHRYDDSPEAWRDLMGLWSVLSFEVCKPQAHAYVFCDFDRFHELKEMMQKAGWYVFRTPLIAHKLNSGRVPLPDQGPRRQYELILYAIKGKKTTTHIYPDVISTSADENMSHGAQKPVALYQNLLQRSVRAGDRVLDTFAGSGTIFEAAHGFKCTAVGVELNKEYYGMCLKRLQALKAIETPGEL